MSIIFILMAVENHFDHFEALPSFHLRWKIIHIYVICLNCFFFSCHNSSIPISNPLSHSWFGQPGHTGQTGQTSQRGQTG